ncbi:MULTISPECIES: hydrogenase expression/formation protein [unclassified Hydrogenobaculum]|jgi:HupH hydrogenase expression protein, C-terminal conserved region.|uniref:hydrogenase expression/formation protein n=1 Tax=unclassified Hydrogenobaculum TaxID=2622382 RepID=UPI001ED94F65|nr:MULTISPECIES: hydrogenase expression/formation protein [unclassified Hydrogenobaculum]
MNAVPILYEIQKALEDFIKTGQNHIIYTNKIPLSEEDKEFLLDVLGEGSIKIEYKSKREYITFKETSLIGVWLGVVHDVERKPILEILEINSFPFMLQAPKEDMEDSIKRLKDILKDFENKGGKDYV